MRVFKSIAQKARHRLFTTKSISGEKIKKVAIDKNVAQKNIVEKTKKVPLATTPSPKPKPSLTKSVSLGGANGVARRNVSSIQLFAQGALGITVAYGIVWGVETQSFMPTKLPYLDMQSMCASGAGMGIAIGAKGGNPSRRFAIGTLAAMYGVYGIASSTKRASSRNKDRATSSSVEGVVKGISLSIITMIPFLSAAISKRTVRFTPKNMVGFVLSAGCLVGALVCDFKPPEVDFFWNYLENKSRNPALFFEWLHWYGYVLLGGGATAAITGPIFMFGHLCYNVMPSKENENERKNQEEEGEGENYRYRQRTVSAFWPMKYSNRYISDHHLYETVMQSENVIDRCKNNELEQFVCGEWVVDVDISPMYDQFLGRKSITWESFLPNWIVNNVSKMQSNENNTSEKNNSCTSTTTTAVLIAPSKYIHGELEVRYTDGRSFRLVPFGSNKQTGKYKVQPLLPQLIASNNDNFLNDLYINMIAYPLDTFFNLIAADSFRLDPNEMWFVDVGGEGDDAYVVLSDGDMRGRYQALRRPKNVLGELHSDVRNRILKVGKSQGFLE
jgi:hypothetical protein